MLNTLATTFGIPVIVSTHPRTRSKIDELQIDVDPLIRFEDPFGFHDYIRLQQDARLVLSDSGSVSEESAILGFPAVTIRDSIERPEALEAGVISLSGLTSEGVLLAIGVCEASERTSLQPPDYFIPNTSQRVINFISSTAKLHNFWSGVRDENSNS
jgi:UDP-N-acetylglucosamine 2-epimerase (non-hydrolysing)